MINKINENLSDQLEYFKEEILANLEIEDMTNAVKEIFYNFCEKCRYRTNYHQCDYFRGFLLLFAVF